MTGFVYFIGVAECEHAWVKIGYTSGSVYARRAALQTGCPFSLEVLAYAPGTMNDEARLHERFAAFRGYGEWFDLDGALGAYVRDLIGKCGYHRPAPTLWTEVYHQELLR